MRDLLEKARSYISENGDMLLIGFLMGFIPGACYLTALVFRLIARALL